MSCGVCSAAAAVRCPDCDRDLCGGCDLVYHSVGARKAHSRFLLMNGQIAKQQHDVAKELPAAPPQSSAKSSAALPTQVTQQAALLATKKNSVRGNPATQKLTPRSRSPFSDTREVDPFSPQFALALQKDRHRHQRQTPVKRPTEKHNNSVFSASGDGARSRTPAGTKRRVTWTDDELLEKPQSASMRSQSAPRSGYRAPVTPSPTVSQRQVQVSKLVGSASKNNRATAPASSAIAMAATLSQVFKIPPL